MRLFPDLTTEMELWWFAGWNKSVASYLPTVRLQRDEALLYSSAFSDVPVSLSVNLSSHPLTHPLTLSQSSVSPLLLRKPHRAEGTWLRASASHSTLIAALLYELSRHADTEGEGLRESLSPCVSGIGDGGGGWSKWNPSLWICTEIGQLRKP